MTLSFGSVPNYDVLVTVFDFKEALAVIDSHVPGVEYGTNTFVDLLLSSLCSSMRTLRNQSWENTAVLETESFLPADNSSKNPCFRIEGKKQ